MCDKYDKVKIMVKDYVDNLHKGSSIILDLTLYDFDGSVQV